jgi:hypothetical protein
MSPVRTPVAAFLMVQAGPNGDGSYKRGLLWTKRGTRERYLMKRMFMLRMVFAKHTQETKSATIPASVHPPGG